MRPKVLMSAYACEPCRGSEPGVGWNWAMSMSRHVDVTVITRSNNRPVIEGWFREQRADTRWAPPEFIYHDPPRIMLFAKQRKLLPVQAFYLVWQIGVSLLMRKKLKDFDLVHHVTFNSMMSPGFWWARSTPVILGPLGGTSCVAREYKALYGRAIWKENLRGWLIRNWSMLPWLRMSFRRAACILCANSETEAYLAARYPEKTNRLLETGVMASEVEAEVTDRSRAEDSMRIIWVGAIEPWKALGIAVRAFGQARAELSNECDLQIDIVGTGSGLEKARSEVAALGLEQNVTFHGALPLEETRARMRTADLMVFSSIKDTSGNVVLEAMSMSKPVVCINHQGAGDMTTDRTAIRVSPGTLQETVDGMAAGIVKLARDANLRHVLGRHGRERILEEYTWEKKAIKMKEIYQRVIGRSKRCQNKA